MFIFKGINSNDMGVYVREENFLGKAPLKYDEIEIDGRDGAEIVPLGYRNFSGTLNDVVITKNNFDEVLNWLSGTGELIYMGKKTRIHFLDAYQIAKHKKTFSVPFIREPFWYDLEDDYSESWGANLIPDGWDSFEPYGSGEILFNSSGIEYDWLVQKSGGADGYRSGNSLTKTNDKGLIGIYYPTLPVDKPQFLTLTVKTTDKSKIIVRYGKASEVPKNVKELISDGKPHTYSFELENLGNNNLIIEFDKRGTYEVTNINISDYGNRHLIVEKTPLENGLTRIQTWGGNSNIKLRSISLDSLGNDKSYTASSYINNIGDNLLEFWAWGYTSIGTVRPNEEEYIVLNRNPIESRHDLRIRVINKVNNLDFIASDPQIVEGDTPPTWEADENPRIVNEGTAPSQPLIKLTKGTTTTCEYEVNGVYFKYHFNTDDHVIIDCEEMEATYNGLPRNRHLTIGFEFPVLKPGDNVVKQISGDAKIEFKRKDRWL